MDNDIDKGKEKTVISNGIKVIEKNMPSSQALRNFSVKVIKIKSKLEQEQEGDKDVK